MTQSLSFSILPNIYSKKCIKKNSVNVIKKRNYNKVKTISKHQKLISEVPIKIPKGLFSSEIARKTPKESEIKGNLKT